MPSRLQDIFERLGQVSRLDDLETEILGLRDRLEVDHVVYHAVTAQGGQYAVLSYPDEWVARYTTQRYQYIDPVVRAAQRNHNPVDWDTLDWSGAGARKFLGESRELGVSTQGLSVPIHGPGGQFSVFTLNHSDMAWARRSRAEIAPFIVAAHFVNEAALRIEDIPQAPGPALSPREIDTLTLLALGHGRGQAAEQLGISEHTLRVYIESARAKLGATNTPHSIARAMSRGLLVF